MGITQELAKIACELGDPRGEWHHVGKFYREVGYYCIDTVCQEWYDDENLETECREELARRKADNANAAQKVLENATVTWLEWGGTRRHPKADECQRENCRVTIKGQTATIETPDGGRFQKRLATRGFEINGRCPRWI